MTTGTSLAGRSLNLAGGLALGLVSGIAAVVVHQSWWLLLAFAAAGTTMVWLRPGAGRVGFAAGWGVVVLRASLPKPEGDYLVSANGAGWTLLAGSLGLLLVAMVTVRFRSHAPEDHRDRPAPT